MKYGSVSFLTEKRGVRLRLQLSFGIMLALQNKMHINDWQSIQTLWDKLSKQLEKTQKITAALGTPRAYVKILVELEDFLNKTLAGEHR
jgi:hypothetical protein